MNDDDDDDIGDARTTTALQSWTKGPSRISLCQNSQCVSELEALMQNQGLFR